MEPISWGGISRNCAWSPGMKVRDLDTMLREAAADPRWVDGMKALLDHARSDWASLTMARRRA